MGKKEKVRKKTEDEIKIIEFIKEYLNKYSAKGNQIRNIDFKEEVDDGFLRFIATIDYGTFEQRILYYPKMLFRENFIDTEFSFDQSRYTHTFYDIFNLFEIDDFNLYFYEDLFSLEEVENALKGILAATEKYSYYLEKAQTDEYLPQLVKNYESDMDIETEEDREEADEGFFMLPFNHPVYSFADGEITAKTLKKLQKRNTKGKLNTIYERRLLKYLEGGKEVSRKTLSEKAEFEKLYNKNNIKAYLMIFALTVVFVTVLSMVIHVVVFKGAYVPKPVWDVFGIAITIPVGRLLACFFESFPLVIGIITLFGRKLTIALMPEELRNRALAKYEKEDKDEYGKHGKLRKAAGVLIVIVITLLVFPATLSDIGFYDDHVKFVSENVFSVSDGVFYEIPYESLEICRVKGYYETDDKYLAYDNAYAVYRGEVYYDLGEVDPNGETQKKLDEIVKKYNKEIKEIKSIEELYENSGD